MSPRQCNEVKKGTGSKWLPARADAHLGLGHCFINSVNLLTSSLATPNTYEGQSADTGKEAEERKTPGGGCGGGEGRAHAFPGATQAAPYLEEKLEIRILL